MYIYISVDFPGKKFGARGYNLPEFFPLPLIRSHWIFKYKPSHTLLHLERKLMSLNGFYLPFRIHIIDLSEIGQISMQMIGYSSFSF